MKKICFSIGNLNHSSGTERVTSLIANSLSEKDFRIYILSLWGGDKPFFSLNTLVKTDSLFSKRISMKINYISAVLKIEKFVEKNNINTLIFVDSISCVFTILALLGLKTNHICWEHFNFNSNSDVRLRDVGRRWAAKYCDYIFTLTQRDKELWENGLKNIHAKIIAIVNPSPFFDIEHTSSINNKIVLAVGRLTEQKGFDLLIDAWKLVCNQKKDWILFIVGNSEDENILKQKVKDYQLEKFIKFIPTTQDVIYYYKKALIYCMSSRNEGFPMVLLDAQTHNLPIIAFDYDTGPSDIIEHGKNGLLVELLNIKALSFSLLKMMNLKQSEYDIYIKESNVRFGRFDIENVLLKWMKII